MNFLFIDNLIPGELAQVMIIVFLHSLWQGLVLAVVARFSLQLTKKWSADSRYNLLLLFLFAFIGCVLVTLFMQLGQPIIANQLLPEQTGVTITVTTTDIIGSILQWGYDNASWIFFVWCVIFLFRVNRMIQDLLTVDRLRQFGNVQIENDWKVRFDELRQLVYIRKKVLFSESSLITQPMVVGVFKPMVLVPLGFLNGLQPKEMEAILLHELAHISRNDYIINLFQSILETIFFFNPFVFWISSMIRDEREHCCDAITIKHAAGKKVFLQALLSVQQHRSINRYAMGLMGKKSLLAARVDRIVSGKNKKVSGMEKMLVAGGYILLFISFVSFSFISINQPRQPRMVNYDRNRDESKLTGSIISPYPRVKFPQSPATKTFDTIPENASEDFIAGYKAAQNYNKQQSMLKESKRKKAQTDKRKPAPTNQDVKQTTGATIEEIDNISETSEAVVAPELKRQNKKKTEEASVAITFQNPDIPGHQKKREAELAITSTMTSDTKNNKGIKQPGIVTTTISETAKNKRKIEEALVAEKTNNQ